MTFDADLVKDLCCPKCKEPVSFKEASGPGEDNEGGFVCQACKVMYPVMQGIPNFLIKDAIPL